MVLRPTLVIALTAIVLGAAPGTSPGAASVGAEAARTRNCNMFAYYPNLKIIWTRNMTCRAAKREMKRYNGSIKRRFRTPNGFDCRRVSGGELGGRWRCVKESRAFRFDFGD